ncbi:hypothetical protein RJ492_001211 [Pluralibacter gergoviae]|uniref:Bacteriophage protein n=1 Tax=Pluralibacter gergoviae TaxID=61647 RepID=A0AAI9DLI4_PLUGE|nr:hypothetical protein [Pluralibacter gergoviae]EKV9907706.1 hypothetical protein [Pluralibacter gergoviae]EKW7276825.1 hypothetical protein [Pluralibacter gergoviae]ELD4293962.1 hypothetical protein [Pluralibacter gergoviae]ELD4304741.1 hypothetical protein [Pluralibacter gergoviae]
MIRNFTDGDIATRGTQFASEKEGTQQAIICRLRLFLGEYFLDATAGTPWFQSILGKNSREVAEINVKQRIISTPGVLGISEFNLVIDARERRMTVTASVVDINNDIFTFLFSEAAP